MQECCVPLLPSKNSVSFSSGPPVEGKTLCLGHFKRPVECRDTKINGNANLKAILPDINDLKCFKTVTSNEFDSL